MVEVMYDPRALWERESAQYRYSLHRAMIRLEDGTDLPGYALHWSNGAESDIAEAYAEDYMEPGNGFYGDMIQESRATESRLPPPDMDAVAVWAEAFADLCEEEGAPLRWQESG